jgi:Cu/Ag efflux pump CusA
MLNSILNQILKTSIVQRWFIVICAILVTVWGVFTVTQMPLDVFPEFAPPQVDIQTEVSGLAPEEVESQITVPIESAVNGLPGVTTVRSSSKVGLSMVQVVFDQEADIYKARQSVTERLQQVTNQLPSGVHPPEISPLASPLGTILQYAFTVNGQGKTSLMDLRRLVDTTLSNQILSVPGVTQVTVYGGDERQEQVLVDPEKMRSLNVSLTEVTNAARGANSNAPGGFLIGGGQELLVRGIGQVKSIADLQQSVVKVQDGKPILLKDVAEVQTGAALKRGDASFNGQPSVVMMVNKLANQTLPQEGTFISRGAERLYRPLLNLSLRSPQIILGVALAALVAAFAIVPSLGRVFLPEFQEKSLVNSMVLYPGVSLDMTNRAGIALSSALKDNPLYEWVQIRAGRTPGDADGAGVSMAHVDVELSDRALQDREGSIKQLRQEFNKLPGVASNIGGFISHRMDEVLSGVRSAIAVKIFGPDLIELRKIGEQVRDVIQPITGVVDLQLEPQLPIRQVQIQYDRLAAATYGLSMEQLSNVVETALNGRIVSQVAENQQLIDISISLTEKARNSLDAIRAIPITTPTGQTIQLGAVAKVEYGMGANVVNREDVSRLIVVSANVAERDLGSVVGDIQSQIQQKIKLPNGYFIQYGGQFESEQRATNNLLVFSILAAIVIAVLMFFSVKSLSATITIMLNLPLALVGGIISIALSGGVISIASLIGFITLFGVAVRNGLLLVDNYNNKFAQGMLLKDVIVNGSLERVNAILMTALTSALGMLPLAIATGAGNEILQPLAIVVLGGLFTSTALTLLVIPALYAKFGKQLMPQQKPVLMNQTWSN